VTTTTHLELPPPPTTTRSSEYAGAITCSPETAKSDPLSALNLPPPSNNHSSEWRRQTKTVSRHESGTIKRAIIITQRSSGVAGPFSVVCLRPLTGRAVVCSHRPGAGVVVIAHITGYPTPLNSARAASGPGTAVGAPGCVVASLSAENQQPMPDSVYSLLARDLSGSGAGSGPSRTRAGSWV